MGDAAQDAKLHAIAGATLLRLDFSEASLAELDLLLFLADASGRKLDMTDAALVTAARERLRAEQVRMLDDSLARPTIGKGKILTLGHYYTCEVACRYLRGTWGAQKKFLRAPTLGVDFRSAGKFVPLADLCGSESYLDLKAELTRTSRASVTLSSVPA
jgi:hypothetical protein